MVCAATRWPPKVTAPRSICGDRSVQPDLDAEFLKRTFRVVRETVGIAVQDLWPRFDEQHARLARIDRAEVPRQRVARQVGDRPGQFDAGRTAADDHEGEQRREPRRVGFALGLLERQEDAAADRGGVFDRLQPGAAASHSSWPK